MTLGAAVLAASLVVVVIGNPFRPAGAVEGEQEAPAEMAGASDGLDGAPLPSAEEGIAGIDGAASPGASPVSPDSSPVPTAAPTGPNLTRLPPRAAAVSSNPTPRPTAGPGPGPTPTRRPTSTPTPTTQPGPTPTPTPVPFQPPPPPPNPTASPTPNPTPPPTPPAPPPPTPAPTPAPTPDCSTVPNLVGLTVSNARAAWIDAGFIGVFLPAFGLNNKIVETQSQLVGACLPVTVSVTVTHS